MSTTSGSALSLATTGLRAAVTDLIQAHRGEKGHLSSLDLLQGEYPSRQQYVLVLTAGDEVAAVGRVDIGDAGGGAGHVSMIHTAAAHRGRGLCKIVMRGLMTAVGAPKYTLEVEADNAPAVACYKSVGFEATGRDAARPAELVMTWERPVASASAKQPRDDGWFPEELPTVVERVEMGTHQYRQYLLAREKEEAEGRGGEGAGGRSSGVMSAPPLALPGSEKKAMSSYYVKSRTLSLFTPPREWAGAPLDEMPDEAFTEATAPKLALIAERGDMAPGPVLVYSQFVESGLKPLGRFLQRRGYAPFVPALPPKKRAVRNAAAAAAEVPDRAPEVPDRAPHGEEPLARFEERATGGVPPRGFYALISGEVPNEARDAIQAACNSPENVRGARIKMILVSKTGAEGLDLKYLRETHCAESYWDRAREDQVKARAVRIGSHDLLPREDRVVQPYIYLTTANRQVWDQMLERDREAQTIDEVFQDRALKQYELNDDFRQVLAETSLECSLFGYGNCRVCVPTDAPLFHDDPALDIRLPDPCRARCETEVQASPLHLRGETYYYTADPASPLGYTFYVFREDLGGYAPLDPSDAVATELLLLTAA